MKRPLQELADALLAPEYRQPLKTVQQACEAIGWVFTERPVCCGEEVELSSFIGWTYQAVCRKCEKFIFDVTGPEYKKSAVCTPDPDKYELKTAVCWVSGQRPTPTRDGNAGGGGIENDMGKGAGNNTK